MRMAIARAVGSERGEAALITIQGIVDRHVCIHPQAPRVWTCELEVRTYSQRR